MRRPVVKLALLDVLPEDGGTEYEVLAKPRATEDGGSKKDCVLAKSSATCWGGYTMKAPPLKSQTDGQMSTVPVNVRKDQGDFFFIF